MAQQRLRGILSRIVLSGLAIGLVSGISGAQAPKRRGKLFPGLESESQTVRAQASAEVLARHQPDDIAAILAIVEKYLSDEARQGTVKDNMLLLGRLRAVQAVPLLVRNLTYEVFYKMTKRLQSTEDMYPAVQALIDIGQPSVRPVLARLAVEGGETLEKNGATTLDRILGRSGARDLLSSEIAAARDEQSQARLRKVMTVLDQLP